MKETPGLLIIILLAVMMGLLPAVPALPAPGAHVHHNLAVELAPDAHRLSGKDDILIRTAPGRELVFQLSPRAAGIEVMVNGQPRKTAFENGRLLVALQPDEQTAPVQVTISYSAVFDDPAPRRPVNTDNPGYGVTGTIAPRGTFLLPGAGWYPVLAQQQATYTLKVTAPAGVVAVTAGRSMGRRTAAGKTVCAWAVDYPVRGLSLSAARYVVDEKAVGPVTAATYLMPNNRHLATSYLDAIARYIKLYSDLFGPYPFQKFAVVENFFPTGFGFASYTLLGGTVLRLPFIIHTSLAHEIAHCWWGNGVYVDYRRGNWCEGLTTYVSDYLLKEKQSAAAARNYRLQWLRSFSVLVQPADDFALSRFESRQDPVTKAIGYDKGAMVFHMLRRLLGENAFWGALQDIYRQRLFKPTSWSDLQHGFERQSKRRLQRFFDQWVKRRGAPRFSLEAVRARPRGSIWQVSGRIVQQKPFYDFPLLLEIVDPTARSTRKINITGPSTAFEMTSPGRPLRLAADPDFDVFRRLDPHEIPPAVNRLKSSSSVIMVLSDPPAPGLRKSARILADALGLANYRIINENKITRSQWQQNDVVLIGLPGRRDLMPPMPAAVKIQPAFFSVNQIVYNQPADVFFGVFKHPDSPGRRVVALFLPLSDAEADIVAAKITHYGKYSYLVFRQAKNMDRGLWPVGNSPLVHTWKAKND